MDETPLVKLYFSQVIHNRVKMLPRWKCSLVGVITATPGASQSPIMSSRNCTELTPGIQHESDVDPVSVRTSQGTFNFLKYI